MKCKKLAVWSRGMLLPGIGFVWTGLCAMALLTQTRLLYKLPCTPDALDGFILSSTFFAYNVVLQGRWVRRAAWVSGAIAAGFYCFLPTENLYTIAMLAAIWAIYYGLWNPKSVGLRTNPVAKPVIVALAWAGATVLLPLPWAQWPDIGALFIGRAAFVFALAIAYDLHDYEQDRRNGLITLANQLSGSKVFWLINTALVLAGGCVVLRWIEGALSWQVAGALGISLLASGGLIFYLFSRHAPDRWRKIGIDGLMLLQAGLVWLVG